MKCLQSQSMWIYCSTQSDTPDTRALQPGESGTAFMRRTASSETHTHTHYSNTQHSTVIQTHTRTHSVVELMCVCCVFRPRSVYRPLNPLAPSRGDDDGELICFLQSFRYFRRCWCWLTALRSVWVLTHGFSCVVTGESFYKWLEGNLKQTHRRGVVGSETINIFVFLCFVLWYSFIFFHIYQMLFSCNPICTNILHNTHTQIHTGPFICVM